MRGKLFCPGLYQIHLTRIRKVFADEPLAELLELHALRAISERE